MIRIFTSSADLARAAAVHAAHTLRRLFEKATRVRLLAATGASQLDFLEMLAKQQGIDWSQVELFHLDEYAGIGMEHPASFARYIKERIADRLGIRNVHLLDGLRDPQEMARDMSGALASAPVQLAFCGIGENGHLAFNDPPADFEAREPYIVVELDEACRKQQVGEGWFRSLDEVPKQAISISIPWLMKSGEIVCVVPDRRKAEAVKGCLEGPVSPLAPASILREHPNTHIFLDKDSASLLNTTTKTEFGHTSSAEATSPG
ncbi:MAG TPA: glucosamine-6-phosphate deaminase [Bryobacteraceae bacterium]|nr:glucosamine-6-phosphate deaminase [Bryobacteraceae bacterium]